jgi:hypothetical protein
VKILDPDKELAERIASRKWTNNGIRKKILEERNLPKRGDPTEEQRKAEIAKVITNEGRKGSRVTRFESKLKRDVRDIINEKVNANLAIYAEFLNRRKIILLRQKLRRLKLQEEAKNSRPKDLFGF